MAIKIEYKTLGFSKKQREKSKIFLGGGGGGGGGGGVGKQQFQQLGPKFK